MLICFLYYKCATIADNISAITIRLLWLNNKSIYKIRGNVGLNPTMKAINAYYKNLRMQFIRTTIRTPKRKNNEGFSYFSSIDDLAEPPRYIGKIEKVGDQRSIIEYMKMHNKY